jgi:hypothetical protein
MLVFVCVCGDCVCECVIVCVIVCVCVRASMCLVLRMERSVFCCVVC